MISLEQIAIKNYRKFYNESITLDNKITAMAGANNSGKTSLVELMSIIFKMEKREYMKVDDMNSKAHLEDEEKIIGIIAEAELNKEQKIEELKELHKKLNKITIELVVKYEDDNDNLEFLSTFLADVDINKKNYYFQVEYEYAPLKEKDILEILDYQVDYREKFSILQSKIYYCDEHFNHRVQIIDRAKFYDLFNFHCVYAVRRLADTSDEKQNFLSKHLLKTVEKNQNWKGNLKELIMNINGVLDQQNLSSEIDKFTLQYIKTTLDSFTKTSGGNSGKLGIDFRLENKDIEKVLLDFIHIYFEQEEGVKIKEQKQGLGYSNLIYLLLEAQIFSEKIDPRKINLLVFEEPEAHLHPQMESVFIRFISAINQNVRSGETSKMISEALVASQPNGEEGEMSEEEVKVVKETLETETIVAATTEIEPEFANKQSPFQMVITTHSSEMTKSIGLNKIRVIRSAEHTKSKVYDLNSFMNIKEVDRGFYEKFFQFNMVEMIFADKLILFEGDAERLLFKYLISNMKKYENLSSQYISYIQVGGAYAYKYLDLIKFLEVKSLIFTDIDYEYKKDDIVKDSKDLIREIVSRKTSNETIKKIVGESILLNIFQRAKEASGKFLSNDKINLKFQTATEGYARTLEDAILHKLLNLETVFVKIKKEEFNAISEEKKLLLSNTNKEYTSLRDRIDKLKNKTDFMYSLIESGNINHSIPKYIEEGLDWLKD
ncbi:AAA family ATPase [Rossellomorea aquimaris]|uniref:AAA family ATPase n=1 Tax=Rossellomorea aquimaris TaxID=189382 RepID=A0A5D4TK47_9BACI|nr:AAA family ATPase [Rossellomorea aquimaris]TYS75319.1 AAA family ATPase [Rossellomorea aquimaris]